MRNTLALGLLSAAALLSQTALAATVTTTADSGSGSLRQAITNAAPGETINFAVTGTITLTSGELLINKSLIIAGPGAANLTVQRSTGTNTPAFRIFNLQSGIVSISGLTIANGRADVGGGINNRTTSALRDCVIVSNTAVNTGVGGGGGGIANASTLTMSNCVVQANSSISPGFIVPSGGGIRNEGTLSAIKCTVSSNAVVVTDGSSIPCRGGGIRNSGTLALTNSTVHGNLVINGGSGGPEGGGIYNSGTATVDTSTVGSNTARAGGGVYNLFGTVTLVRSTVSGNGTSALGIAGSGGGLLNSDGTLIVENSTISGNASLSGGGISSSGSATLSHSTITANSTITLGSFNNSGFAEIFDTILAGNIGTNDFFNTANGIVDSAGFNLIGTTNGPITPGPSDTFNVTAAQLRIGPLQDNGGPTFTHALLCGSPAINTGDNTNAPPTDQRGFPRIVYGVIDIGAYEFSNTPPTITCSANVTNCAPPTGELVTLSASVADADGNPLVVVWTVDGMSYQTNFVAPSGPPTTTNIDLTAQFGVGIHQVAVWVTDTSECTATCSTTVALYPGPTVVAENDGPVCAGKTLNLTATSATAVSFSWSGPNRFTSTLQNPSIPNATPAASGDYVVEATDANGCTAAALTSATVTAPASGDLYPIALSWETLAGVEVGDIVTDIYNGVQPGNFGWLTWAGSPNEPTLAVSLMPPGNSRTYVNPFNPLDHVVSVGDWVQGKPGVSNSGQVRKALETLKRIDIVVPVWDRAIQRGNNSLYRVVAFARVRLTDYQLPNQNRISARFLGYVGCN